MDAGEQAAFRFFAMRGRKLGIGIQIAQTDLAEFKSIDAEEADAILGNVNCRIFMASH